MPLRTSRYAQQLSHQNSMFSLSQDGQKQSMGYRPEYSALPDSEMVKVVGSHGGRGYGSEHQAVDVHATEPASKPSSSSPAESVLTAGACYVLTSASLIIFNKHALSSFHWQCPNCLLFFHCLLAVLIVKGGQAVGLLKQHIEPLRWALVKEWFPVNLIFVGMIATSFLALQLVGVGMFTILKNLSNLLAICGDWYFFGRTYGPVVWLCIMLMVLSAAAGGATDISFSWAGYTWQLINCLFTSGYALYLSHVMVRVQALTHDKGRMGELSMVYYNNVLSLGPIFVLACAFGELPLLLKQPALTNPEFLAVALLGGVLGCGISFTSLWFVSRSSATVYSLTGSMNKVIVALAGILLFHEASTVSNTASILLGLLAGVLFVVAKAYVPK